MGLLSIILLFIITELSKVSSQPQNGCFCSLPCPLMYPAPSPWANNNGNMNPRRPFINSRDDFDNNQPTQPNQEQDESGPEVSLRNKPAPENTPNQPVPNPNKPPTPPTPPPEASDESPVASPSYKKKPKEQQQPQPSRRFFTSLFSIPGAIVDSLISGEVVV